MQHKPSETHELLDAIVTTMGEALGSITSRIKALESEQGLHVLDDIDPENYYKHGQLAQSREHGGLWQYDAMDEEWECIVPVINQVTVEEADGGSLFKFTKSNGAIIERLVTTPKPTRRKAVKAIAA